MTKREALIEVASAAEAIQAVGAAREEIQAMVSNSYSEARTKVYAAVTNPDDRLAQRESRRAVGALARTIAASLELHAVALHNAATARSLIREHRISEYEVLEARAMAEQEPLVAA